MKFLLYFLGNGPAAIFAWGVIKSIIPFPTPSILMFAGAAINPPGAPLSVSLPALLIRIALPGAAGITIGSYVYFKLAAARGNTLLKRYGPRAGLSKPAIVHLEAKLGRHKGLFLFSLRALPVIPIMAGSVVGGLLDISIVEFTFWTFFGSALRCLFLGYLGYWTRTTLG